MSRSRKKPYEWISKRFPRWAKKAWRHCIKQKCHEIEIDFDPDRDYDDFHIKEAQFGDWGTKCGWDLPPGDCDDTWVWDNYEKMIRK